MKKLPTKCKDEGSNNEGEKPITIGTPVVIRYTGQVKIENPLPVNLPCSYTNFDDVPRKVKNSSLIISPFDDWTITNSGGSKRASPKCLGRFSLLQKQLRKLHR